MTIDEAIADCIAQVPECCEGLRYEGEWLYYSEIIDLDRVCEKFFLYAYSFLPNTFEYVIRRSGSRPETWCVWGQDADEIWELKYQGPTEFHAMRAAVLLAKGLKP
jgi:hypothetical protein